MKRKHTESRIYKRALELIALTRKVLEGFPPGYGFLSDQIRRASSSVLLNYAEGCGKQSPRERKRYFTIARGSANESGAILDAARCFGIISDDLYDKGDDICDHLAAMLTKYK